jgi:predicted RNase H-like HicB family nuclease
MPEINPLRIELELEQDGRWLASVPELPGVMAYGVTEEEAIRKAKAVALQILADMIENGEEVPASMKVLFVA